MTSHLEDKVIISRFSRIWIASAIIASLFSVVCLAGAYYWTVAKVEKPTQAPHEGMAVDYINLPNKLNVLVLGVDTRPQDGDPGRSDTTMVFTIDTETREITQMSIPRDTWVLIKGHGWDKINHAFSFGGLELSKETVENFLGINIDYYAVVNIENFPTIIDAVGGVTLDVERRMYYVDTWDYYVIDLQPGVQLLDGRTALQYVRFRDSGGDVERVPRQQKFVKALLTEVNQPSIILKASGIIREINSALDTDMPADMIVAMAKKFSQGMRSATKTYAVQGLPYYINDISYWVPNIMKTREMVAEMQGVPFDGSARASAERQAAQFARNLPANAHFDDGSYYAGITKEKPVEKAKIDEKKILVIAPPPMITPPVIINRPETKAVSPPVRVLVGQNNATK